MKVVISLGGSVFYGKKIDSGYLKEFSEVVKDFAKKGNKVVVITGGGKAARDYVSAMQEFRATPGLADMPAILVTQANAMLLMALFGKLCNSALPRDFCEVDEKLKLLPIVVCGGFLPGVKTDEDAAIIADYVNADKLVNVTNVKGIYDRDPNKFKAAKFISKISHEDYIKLILPLEIGPGAHAPFALIATKIAQRADTKIYVIGKDAENLRKCINGKKFDGTIIG